MTITNEELKEKLKSIDEVSLLEKLEIYSDDIVDRFDDKIEEKWEQLILDFDEGDCIE